MNFSSYVSSSDNQLHNDWRMLVFTVSVLNAYVNPLFFW
jgi:hypothetical protein